MDFSQFFLAQKLVGEKYPGWSVSRGIDPAKCTGDGWLTCFRGQSDRMMVKIDWENGVLLPDRHGEVDLEK